MLLSFILAQATSFADVPSEAAEAVPALPDAGSALLVDSGAGVTVAVGLPDLLADAGSGAAGYALGWASHKSGKRWLRRLVPVVKVVASAGIRSGVEVLLMGGDWRVGLARGALAGLGAVFGRQTWSKTIRGNLR